MSDILKKIWSAKCPKCGQGRVFVSKGNVFLFKAPKMNAKCECCGYNYEKEPGYFIGAMYVSYALTIAEMVALFLFFKVASLPMDNLIYFIMGVIFLLWPFNFRVSRLVWMNLF